MSSEVNAGIAGFIIFALIVIYVIGGSVLEHYKSPIGHETSVALIFGILISLIVMYTDKNDNISEFFEFNDEIFFYIFLPPIVFSSGYNMRRKRFFENIGYVILFGVFGTFICFTLFTIFTQIAMNTGALT